ncbi:nitroreductase family protein [bacterium]|nr:nitroreductase family protein [bacterium]MBU1675915.1 nitroreductase family protein [bacterium]
MEFRDLISARYSCRAYRADPVPDDDLACVLEAARLAPTADNRQPFGLVVMSTAGRKAELSRIYGPGWFVQAPLVIAVCGEHDRSWKRKSDGWSSVAVDAAIVTDHLVLAAADRGLGTCWVCAFDPAAAREVLGLPEGIEPIAFTPLGWPADAIGTRSRRDLAELVHRERWS